MEGQPQGVVGADFQFHRHSGIHLESKTYHTLLQIFTHCYGNSPLSSAPPILPPPPPSPPSENNGGSPRISECDGGGEIRLSEELDVSMRREPDDSSAPPILPPPPPTSPSENNGGIRRILDGDDGVETRFSKELNVSGRREPYDSSGQEGTELVGGVKDADGRGTIDATQRRIDELEQIMQEEDNGNDLVGNETEGSDSRKRDMSREQILMSQLQGVMEGSEEWFNDGCANFHGMVLEDPQGNDGVSGQLNIVEQFDDLQRLAEEESGSPGLAQSKECRLEASETVVSPLEMCGLMNKDEQSVDLERISEEESQGIGHVQSEMEEYRLGAAGNLIRSSEIGGTDEVLKPSGISEQISSTQHKETGLEQPASSNHILHLTGEMVESHELEDGEISGDDSGNMVVDDAILSEQNNGDERQLSNDLTNKNECTPNAEDGSKRRMEAPAVHDIHGTSRSGKIEFEESNLNKMVDEGKEVHENIGSGSQEFRGNLDQFGNNMTEVTSGEKDGDLSKKRKRGPGKEKKKTKERKKRAKMRRELGLDRVKVKPIVKPKTVSYCRHYLAGKCYEGEQCKFSHDAVPFTKSKPCRFFARDACMKGDNCPFDHQLSKYPCDNYTNKGFCSRGDSCLFSHKMPSEGASPSFSQPEKSDSKSPKSKSVNTKQQQNVFETPQKMVGGEQNLKSLSGTVQRKLPPRRTQSRPTGDLTNEGALDAAKNINSSSGPVVSKKVAAPVVAPAGINFLSFGRGPAAVSSSYNLESDEDRSKQVPHKNSSGIQANNAASRDHTSTQMGNGSPPAVPPHGLSFLSFGRKIVDDSMLGGKLGTPSSEKDGDHLESQHGSDQQNRLSPIMKTATSVGSSRLSDLISHRNATNPTLQTLNSCPLVYGGPEKNKSAQEIQHAPDKQFNGTATLKLPANPSTTGQSSDQSANKSLSKFRRDTVMSTLSWASNFNSKSASLPVGSGVNGGGESSTAAESNLVKVKVSKIVDLLSSIHREAKH